MVWCGAPHRPDSHHALHGLALLYFGPLCLEADEVGEVLEVEQQQLVAQVQEGQTLEHKPNGAHIAPTTGAGEDAISNVTSPCVMLQVGNLVDG